MSWSPRLNGKPGPHSFYLSLEPRRSYPDICIIPESSGTCKLKLWSSIGFAPLSLKGWASVLWHSPQQNPGPWKPLFICSSKQTVLKGRDHKQKSRGWRWWPIGPPKHSHIAIFPTPGFCVQSMNSPERSARIAMPFWVVRFVAG